VVRAGKNSARAKKRLVEWMKRLFENGKRKVTAGCEWVAAGGGMATEMVDGECCAVIGGVLYRRCVAKYGQHIPKVAIAAQETDKSGNRAYWLPIDARKESDRWFVQAWINTPWMGDLKLGEADGVYEAVGLHFKGNPYGLDADFLEKHGRRRIPDFPRDYYGIRDYFRAHEDLYGVVFWKDGEPKCEVKRTDFGLEWPEKGGE